MNTLASYLKPTHPIWAMAFRPFYLLSALYAVISILLWGFGYTGTSALSGYFWHAHEMIWGRCCSGSIFAYGGGDMDGAATNARYYVDDTCGIVAAGTFKCIYSDRGFDGTIGHSILLACDILYVAICVEKPKFSELYCSICLVFAWIESCGISCFRV